MSTTTPERPERSPLRLIAPRGGRADVAHGDSGEHGAIALLAVLPASPSTAPHGHQTPAVDSRSQPLEADQEGHAG